METETQITIEWDMPASEGGCAIRGYLGYLEDIEEPGFMQVYIGITQSAIMKFELVTRSFRLASTTRCESMPSIAA